LSCANLAGDLTRQVADALRAGCVSIRVRDGLQRGWLDAGPRRQVSPQERFTTEDLARVVPETQHKQAHEEMRKAARACPAVEGARGAS
jgi:hypothetical protein